MPAARRRALYALRSDLAQPDRREPAVQDLAGSGAGGGWASRRGTDSANHGGIPSAPHRRSLLMILLNQAQQQKARGSYEQQASCVLAASSFLFHFNLQCFQLSALFLDLPGLGRE
jgi:hypothetical protein